MSRRTKRLIGNGIVAVAGLVAVLFVSFGSSDTGTGAPTVELLREAPKTFTLGWTPHPGASGYLFYADGKRVSWTLNANRARTTFWKGSSRYEIRPFVLRPSLSWSTSTRSDVAPFGADAATSETGISLVSETTRTVTLGWQPAPEVIGYLFYVDGARVSWTLNASRTQVTFGKNARTLEVRPIAELPAGVWLPAQPAAVEEVAPDPGAPLAPPAAEGGNPAAAIPTPETTPAITTPATTTTTTTRTAAPAAAAATTTTTTTTTTATPPPAPPTTTTTAAPAVAPPAPTVSGISAPSWTIRLETNQTDRGSESGNRYTFGWVKSLRPHGTRGWEDESVVEFSDYPDEFVMVEAKRFESGYPGRVTNFHLVGTDGAGGGISPLSADYHYGVSSDASSDIQRGLVLTCEPELIEQRRGIWQLLTESEINADRGAVWTLVWRIRWRQDRSGYAKVSVFRNGSFVRRVETGSIRTAYSDQQPRVYAWLGGYESAGLSSPAQIGQTLDYRGRTLDAALADRPSLGSTMTSVSTGGGSDSSVSGGSSFTLPVEAIRSNG